MQAGPGLTAAWTSSEFPSWCAATTAAAPSWSSSKTRPMLLPQATAERAIWRSGCSHGGMQTSIWYMGSKVTTWVGAPP